MQLGQGFDFRRTLIQAQKWKHFLSSEIFVMYGLSETARLEELIQVLRHLL